MPSVVTIAAGPNAYEGGAPGSFTLSFWANGKEFKETVSISLNEKSADFGSVPSYLIERAEFDSRGRLEVWQTVLERAYYQFYKHAALAGTIMAEQVARGVWVGGTGEAALYMNYTPANLVQLNAR